MDSVVATSEPTSTLAPGANSTPFGLVRNTWPFAVRRPKISDGTPPTTRLSATEEAPGWLKFTCAPTPMENESQLMMARWLDWSICMTPAPGVEIVAVPDMTLPPVGRSVAATPGDAKAAAVAAARKRIVFMSGKKSPTGHLACGAGSRPLQG